MILLLHPRISLLSQKEGGRRNIYLYLFSANPVPRDKFFLIEYNYLSLKEYKENEGNIAKQGVCIKFEHILAVYN
jgi:hypothetical protein